MVPVVRRSLHVIPAQAGRHFSPQAVRLDCRKNCQNSGGKAFGSSIIPSLEGFNASPEFFASNASLDN